MGRLRWLWAIPVLLLVITGCENSLQEYIATNLFGPPYNLEVARLSAQGAIDFGFSVDINGDYIIVGAPAEYDNDSHPEAAYIYRKTSIDTWDSGCKLLPSSGWQAGDNFGYSVALYGDYAAVGAPHKTVNGHNAAGAVYIFKRIGTNSWEQLMILTQDDLWSTDAGFLAENHDLFGSAVDMYGNWLLIAARQDNLVGFSNAGAVYAFKNTGSWTYDQQLTAGTHEEAGAMFGWSVNMNSDYIAVGAIDENTGTADNAGAVHIFQFIVDGWEYDTRITAPDGEEDDAFGVSISIDDSFLAVSAPIKTVDSAAFSGKAYIFQNSSSGAWSTVPFELTPGTSHENDYFGISVSLRGNFAIIGSVFRDEAATDSGAAYIYTRDSGNIWELQKTFTPSDAAVGTYFGASIAIGNTYAVIGATNMDVYHANGGVYVFR